MGNQLIECVPNFSEGRREEVMEAIVAPFKRQKGCALFDYRGDPDHNRLVVSLVGEPEAVQKALLKAAQVAVEKIDMNQHQGGHPRIGAVDVIPFVPLRNMSMEQCIQLAHGFGQRFQEKTGVPVYFYEQAAKKEERKRLEVIRKGQYETLKEEVSQPERHPDLGEPALHPTAGATVIGARKFLVAFNVNLETTDVKVAKQIAAAVRSSSGGLCHTKGIGLALEDQGCVQVSMNIVDYEKNALYRVLELIRMEAKRFGVGVRETELYGMVPAAALLDSVAYYMQISGFDPNQIIEMRLLESMGDGE
jgi:glutamate formiminotransferase